MKSIIKIIKNQEFLYHLSGTTEQEISDVEKKLGVKFADDYKDYVKEFGIASFNGHELSGICDFERLNVLNLTLKHKDNIFVEKNHLYVIEEFNNGETTIYQNEDGHIFSVYRDGNLEKIANSLEKYILECN